MMNAAVASAADLATAVDKSRTCGSGPSWWTPG